jgi:hypothetical protein
MNVKKYIGMYVHQETISIAVMTSEGKLVMEIHRRDQSKHHPAVCPFVQGLHGDLHLTFEEGTWAAWLYDLYDQRHASSKCSHHHQSAKTQNGGLPTGSLWPCEMRRVF